MRMAKNYLNLEMTKGDTLSFGVQIYDLGQNLETAYFTVKTNYDDEQYLLQKSLNNGITLDHVAGDDYYYVVRLAPADTEALELGKYYYDLQIALNEDVFTILKGVFTLDFEVTGGGIN